MNGLMSPTSPEAYRKETGQVYASGWPPAFLGDLYYYLVDDDLTHEADKIDTRLTKIFEGTSEIQQRIISDNLLGKATRG